MTQSVQRVLGIDPGTQHTGFGVVDACGNEITLVASGVVRTFKEESATLAERLQLIYRGLQGIIEQYAPQVMVVESLFHSINAASALKLGHARGVAMLAGAEANLKLFEYTPRAIKKGLTGSGSAGKEQVQKMVRILLKGAHPSSLDASDALAVAIYHCHLNPWLKRTMRYTSGTANLG